MLLECELQPLLSNVAIHTCYEEIMSRESLSAKFVKKYIYCHFFQCHSRFWDRMHWILFFRSLRKWWISRTIVLSALCPFTSAKYIDMKQYGGFEGKIRHMGVSSHRTFYTPNHMIRLLCIRRKCKMLAQTQGSQALRDARRWFCYNRVSSSSNPITDTTAIKESTTLISLFNISIHSTTSNV